MSSDSIFRMIPKSLDHLWVIRKALVNNAHFRTACALLVGTVVLKKAHNAFSQAALNNFTRDSYDWKKEIVVVTGGSGGLGDLLVRKLAKKSIKVISVDVVPPAEPLPENAFFYQMDISKAESIKQVADEIRKDHGDPTILVNNAGVMKTISMLDESEEDVRRVFDINIIANFLLIKEFLPAMVKQNHGHIVNIASVASFVTCARNVSYSCTKLAVLALHEGLAQELQHVYKASRIRTSIVHPVYIRTPMLESLVNADALKARVLDPREVVDRVFNQIMSGNSGQLFVPGSLSFTASARGWPAWLQSALRRTQKDIWVGSKV